MCVKVFFQKILPVFTEFPVFALVMFDRGNLVPFCLPKKEPKRPWGPPSMSAYAQRALIGGLPPDPHITGDALLKNFYTLPAALRQDLYSFSPRPTGAYMGRN